MSDAAALDLGIADVHIPTAIGNGKKKAHKMSKLPAKTRNALPRGKFALPEDRKYPIENAAHVRDAESRLEGEREAGKIDPAKYRRAKRNIARAAKRFGVASKYSKPKSKMRINAELGEGGSLHVRHMSIADGERDVWLDGVPVTLSDDGDDKPIWIQLAKPGTFRGHPSGPFELNERVFSEIVRNFKQTVNHRIPIDFEHASEAPATEGSIPTEGAPAQGWITDMAIRAGNLWGLVEWLEPLRTYIKEKKYQFFSPAIRFNAKDRVTGAVIGARMTSGAATNSPFLDGLSPLAAKDKNMTTPTNEQIVLPLKLDGLAHHPSEYMPKLKECLKLHPLSTAEECSDHLEKLRDHLESCGGNANGVHEGINLGDYCMGLRQLVSARPGDTLDDVFDRVQDMIDAAMAAHVQEYHEGDVLNDDGGDDADMSEKAALASLKNMLATLAI